MILLLQFEQAVVLFGEDAEKTTILDFFTIFSNFLTSFNVSQCAYVCVSVCGLYACVCVPSFPQQTW